MRDKALRGITTFNRIARVASGVLAGACLVLLLTLVTISTAGRWLGVGGVLGADELSRYLLVATVYFGVTYSVASGAFLRVTLLYRLYPRRVRRVVDPVLVILSALAVGLMAYRATGLVHETFTRSIESTGVLRTPIYMPQAPVVVGLWVLVLHMILSMITMILGHHKAIPDAPEMAAYEPNDEP